MVGMEVRSRGTRYGGGCIDCVRLVQREEIGKTERGQIEKRDVDEDIEKRRSCGTDNVRRGRKKFRAIEIRNTSKKKKTKFNR